MSENLLGFREGSGDRCSKWRELPKLRNGGKQCRCAAGEHVGRTGKAHYWSRWGLVRKDPRGLPEMGLYSGRGEEEPLEVREQERDMP